MRYTFNLEEIKTRLKKLRNDKGITQVELAKAIYVNAGTGTGRTTITTWESQTNQIIPDLRKLIDLCNYFEVDMNYILGWTEIKSDTHQIATRLQLSEATVMKLTNNPEYGSIVDGLASDTLISEVVYRTRQLGNSLVLEDVINTSFKKSFIVKIRRLFEDYYYSAFPMDMAPHGFEEYLIRKMPYSQDFDPQKYLEDNFLEDGEAFVGNKFENYGEAEPCEQHHMIISAIVDICYDYFISTQVIALSKQRLYNTIATVFDNIIEKEAKSIKESIKDNVKKES